MEIFAAALIYPLIKLIVNPETEIFTNYLSFVKNFQIFDGAYNQHLTIILLIVLLSSLKAIIFLINVFFQSRTIASINLRLSTELYEKYLNLDWVSISKKIFLQYLEISIQSVLVTLLKTLMLLLRYLLIFV